MLKYPIEYNNQIYVWCVSAKYCRPFGDGFFILSLVKTALFQKTLNVFGKKAYFPKDVFSCSEIPNSLVNEDF